MTDTSAPTDHELHVGDRVVIDGIVVSTHATEYGVALEGRTVRSDRFPTAVVHPRTPPACDGMPCAGSGYIRVLTAERDDARRQVKEAIAQNNREWAETALDDEAAAYADGKSDGWASGILTGWAIGCAVWLPMVVWVAVPR